MGFKVIIGGETVWEAPDDARVRRVGLVSVGGEKGAALIEQTQDSVELVIEQLPAQSVTTRDDHAYPANVQGPAFNGGDNDPDHDTRPGMSGVTVQGAGSAVTPASVGLSNDESENNGSSVTGRPDEDDSESDDTVTDEDEEVSL